MKIGLIGLGHVGRAVVQMLKGRRDVKIVHIADRHPARKIKGLGLSASAKVSKDWKAVLKDAKVEMVVELIGGLHPAREIAMATLRSGKPLVTANKMVVSRCWDELHGAAWKHGGALRLEAAVAGGIPLIDPIESDLSSSPIDEVVGILNGTTNYLLCEMGRTGRPFREALAQAQRLGFAERDPSFDLKGIDVTHKISILGSILGGGWLEPGRIPTEGIERLDAADLGAVYQEFGFWVKLVGRLRSGKAGIESSVSPVLVPRDHPLAGVHGPNNAVLVKSRAAGELMFYGPGAGPFPAASAVVADIAAFARGDATALRPTRKLRLADPGRALYGHGIRLYAADRPGVLAKVAKALGRRQVSIARILQSPSARKGKFSARILILTHPAVERRMGKAIADFKAMPELSPDILHLRTL